MYYEWIESVLAGNIIEEEQIYKDQPLQVITKTCTSWVYSVCIILKYVFSPLFSISIIFPTPSRGGGGGGPTEKYTPLLYIYCVSNLYILIMIWICGAVCEKTDLDLGPVLDPTNNLKFLTFLEV